MEQKKKRFRPTLRAYRELDRENKQLKEIVNSLSDFETIVRDNTVYRQALINFSSMIRVRKDPALLIQASEECDGLIGIVYNDIKKRWDEDANKLKVENETLKRSNKFLEDSRNRLEEENDELTHSNEELSFELKMLRKRSFLKRLFNKE